jgi:hypothetical protein
VIGELLESLAEMRTQLLGHLVLGESAIHAP